MLRLLPTAFAMVYHTARTGWRQRGLAGDALIRDKAVAQQQGARAVLRALGVRLRVEGVVPDRPMLIAPNHTSWLDGFLMAAVFRTALAGRHDVLVWPFFGRVARTMGVVPVYRERTSATGDFVADVQQRLAAGVSMLAFPEGTTTHGDALLPFKTGMFEAVAGTPHAVLPVYHQVVQAKGRPVTPDGLAPFTWAGEGASLKRSVGHLVASAPVEVVVRIGQPIPAQHETRKTLAAKAQQSVEKLRAEVQAEAHPALRA